MSKKEPEYLLVEKGDGKVTLTIDCNGSELNPVHLCHGIRRALSNGDLVKVVEHNTWNDQPLLGPRQNPYTVLIQFQHNSTVINRCVRVTASTVTYAVAKAKEKLTEEIDLPANIPVQLNVLSVLEGHPVLLEFTDEDGNESHPKEKA